MHPGIASRTGELTYLYVFQRLFSSVAGEMLPTHEPQEEAMRGLIVLAALGCLAGPALADTCSAQATAKNLHGAAQTSFMKKCTADVTAKCGADAKAKKLHGAAETSFTAKCVHDGTGA